MFGYFAAMVQQQNMERQALRAMQDARAAYYQDLYGDDFCGLNRQGWPVVRAKSPIPKVERGR